MIKSVLIAAIMTGSIAMILPASAAQITIYGRIDSGVPLTVKITFATLSVLHGVVKHAIFAGVYR